MTYLTEKKSLHSKAYLRITGTDSPSACLMIPAESDGLPVRELAHHAFESDTSLQEVVLPDGLQSVGRFAFLNCSRLKALELTDSVQSFSDTALRQCDALSIIRVHIIHDDARVLSQLLAAVEKEITLELIYPDGKALLLFPDYNYVYTEHTMSRAFLFNIDGCGMAYRECAGFDGINFREYDKLFEKERVEDPHTAPFLALGRLMYPYHLSPVAKENYMTYFKNDLYLTKPGVENHVSSLSTQAGDERVFGVASYAAGDGVFLLSAENRDEKPDFLKALIQKNDTERLTFLMKAKLLSKDAARLALEYTKPHQDIHSAGADALVGAGKNTLIRALLMDYLREPDPHNNTAARLLL